MRNAAIKFGNKFIPYPFQNNLSYLPQNIKLECLFEYIHSYNAENVLNKDYGGWLQSFFGKGIYRHFMEPYNSKLWKTPLAEITTDLINAFIPQPDLKAMIESATFHNNNYSGYNHNFYYPQKGGIGRFMDALFQNIHNHVILNSKVIKIDLKNKILFMADRKIKFEKLITTIPMPEFINIAFSKKDIIKYNSNLEYISVYNPNAAIESSIINKFHWLYFPEAKYSFYRLGFYHNFSLFNVPRGNYHSAYIEISYKNNNSRPSMREIKNHFFDVGIYTKKNSKIMFIFPLDIKYAYIIFNKKRAAIIKHIFNILNKNAVYSLGRYAEWTYSSMQDSIAGAIKMSEKILLT